MTAIEGSGRLAAMARRWWPDYRAARRAERERARFGTSNAELLELPDLLRKAATLEDAR